ncbi:MAG: hypothetical protein WBW84_13220 [Acidobacteriaceae bacterium]
MLSNGDSLFVFVLMARHGIGIVVLILGLIFNVRYFEDHEADWRVRSSWGSLALFSMAVAAEWVLGGAAPVWAGQHLWGLGLFCLVCFGGAFVLAVVGRGWARVPLAVGSVVLGWLWWGTVVR